MRAEHSPPVSVPVVVENHVKPCVKSIVHNLLNTVDICGPDSVVTVLPVHRVCPCDRNPDAVKTCGLVKLHHFGSRNGLTPENLILFRVLSQSQIIRAESFHRIAQVDSVSHDFGKLQSGKRGIEFLRLCDSLAGRVGDFFRFSARCQHSKRESRKKCCGQKFFCSH